MKLFGVVLLLFVFVGLAIAGVLVEPVEVATEIPAEFLTAEAPPVAVAQMPVDWCLNDLVNYATRSSDHFDHGRQWHPNHDQEQIHSVRRAAGVIDTLNSRNTDLGRALISATPLWYNCNRGHSSQSGRFSGATA